MKFPRITGYGFVVNLMIVFDAKYVTTITPTNAAAAYQLRLSELTPIVGATIKTLAIIEPKQHGQGAIIAREVAVDVFLSCNFHSLMVKSPAIIMIKAIMI